MVHIPYKYAASLTVAIALFMAILDSTIVNVSLVAMERDFGTSINSVQWVVTGYTLAQAAVIPVAGYLANRFGIKRLFLLALAIFTVGSLLCGISREIAEGRTAENLLIWFRVVQALGGGMLIPLGTSIAFASFPPAERAASSALISIPILFAPALGPTVGGLIVDSRFEWPGIFFINVPIGIVAFSLIRRIVKPDPPAPARAAGAGFDWTGLVLSMVGAVLVIYAFVLVGQTKSGSVTQDNPAGDINGWGYWLVWALLAAGVGALLAFAFVELRVVKDPVLDLRILRDRDFASASLLTWGSRAVVFGGFLLVPLFLQQYAGRSAVYTGLTLTAQGIGAIIGIQIGSRLYDRIGPRFLSLSGFVLIVISTFLLAQVSTDSSASFFLGPLFLRGLGFGGVGLPLQTVALANVTGAALPKASSLYNATAQIFTSIGTAVVTTLLVQRTTFHGGQIAKDAIAAGQSLPADLQVQAGAAGMADVFLILAIGTILVGLIAFLLPRYSLRQLMKQGKIASEAERADDAELAAGVH